MAREKILSAGLCHIWFVGIGNKLYFTEEGDESGCVFTWVEFVNVFKPAGLEDRK